jgi:hypothetical protein
MSAHSAGACNEPNSDLPCFREHLAGGLTLRGKDRGVNPVDGDPDGSCEIAGAS